MHTIPMVGFVETYNYFSICLRGRQLRHTLQLSVCRRGSTPVSNSVFLMLSTPLRTLPTSSIEAEGGLPDAR